ncbi:mannose-6-phosphate isomerase, class I [Celerinatantimonas yamalensis]|uniref:mannose-6-phosphate isomerase n=1 Tax=Celerinatantimonas yamalensis TaxID=559956 RepID=A0ABW9G8A9_9GAMM
MNTPQHPHFYRMHNPMQHYAWGSTDQLNHLFGISNPDGQPQAEIWMGAHPNGCSQVNYQEQSIPLSELIAKAPSYFLGTRTMGHFGQLPFLFKVLSAAQALSIQVHPSMQQAKEGFAKEQQAGIDLTDPKRNYKDPNHKPELVYALTRYQAMNGFRPIETILTLFKQFSISALVPLVTQLSDNQNAKGLEQFFGQILSLSGQTRHQAIEELVSYSRKHTSDPLAALINELHELYPDDVGLFAPLILNVMTLEPGDAMFLYACTPHAYLKGTGLEVMASSDNVLRAGLTPKYIDVPELLSCTEFVSKEPQQLLMQPRQVGDGDVYPIPVNDFRFAIYQDCDVALSCDSAEIIFAIDSKVQLSHYEGESITLQRGQSAFIAAGTASYRILTAGRVARAYC